MAHYTAADILEQLDGHAAEYTFPMLDNGYVYPADVRLSAYRDERRWAILIEVLGHFYRSGLPDGISTTIYRFGNCLRGEAGHGPTVDALSWEEPVEEDEEDDSFSHAPRGLAEVQ